MYPKLHDDERSDLHKMNFMLDKQKVLREKLAHYKKIKSKWAVASRVLKITGISVSCILGGASILTIAPFSIPIAAAILSGLSLGNVAVSNLLVEGFTNKRLRYLRLKCDHVKNYLNKMETLFMKCREGDEQISPDEFEQFMRLFKEYENGMNVKSEIKSKDLKKAQKMAKKEIRQQRLNILYNNVLQEQQQQQQQQQQLKLT